MNILPRLIVGDSGVPYAGRELNSQGMCEAHVVYLGFPRGSVGKESTHNAGNPGLIPGRGRSPGERNGNPLQYSWSSLAAQTVKNLPAIRETWVLSLGQKDPLEKRMTTHSSILPWKIPWTVQSGRLQSTSLRKVGYN